MIRQYSNESNKRTSRRSSQHDCDSEVSIDGGTENSSRPSNISSYAEYTESDGEEEDSSSEINFETLRRNGEKCSSEVRKTENVVS